MSATNGVVRIGRKGIVKFAFGEDGKEFALDVVTAWSEWSAIDDGFRQKEGPDEGAITATDLPGYQQAAFQFAAQCAGEGNGPTSLAEALDFIARLREQYDGLVNFFRPRSPDAPASPDSLAAELRFSAEES